MAEWRQVADLAREQHGLVARRQLIKLGIPDQSIDGRVRRDGWRRTGRGVYALPGVPSSYEQQVMAAVLATGEHALASHLTAAYLHGAVSVRPPVIDLLLPYQHRSRRSPGVHVTRTRTLKAGDRCLVRGIPTTTLPRTIIDAATVLEPPGIRALIIDARQKRHLDLARVAARLLEIGPVRHCGEVRRVLDEFVRAAVDSVLEGDVRTLLRRRGLPPPHPAPYRVWAGDRHVELDIAWPELKVGIEVDGYGAHSSRTAMDKDHRKQNALVLQGWRILRVSWDRILQAPEGFVQEVAALLVAAM